MALELKTTDTELHNLWQNIHSTRESSSTVRVDKEALRHLLVDHHTLYSAATGAPARFDGRPVGKGNKIKLSDDQASMSGDVEA